MTRNCSSTSANRCADLASAVRNTDKAPISDTPSYFGNTRQIEVLPLPEEPGQYDWRWC